MAIYYQKIVVRIDSDMDETDMNELTSEAFPTNLGVDDFNDAVKETLELDFPLEGEGRAFRVTDIMGVEPVLLDESED